MSRRRIRCCECGRAKDNFSQEMMAATSDARRCLDCEQEESTQQGRASMMIATTPPPAANVATPGISSSSESILPPPRPMTRNGGNSSQVLASIVHWLHKNDPKKYNVNRYAPQDRQVLGGGGDLASLQELRLGEWKSGAVEVADVVGGLPSCYNLKIIDLSQCRNLGASVSLAESLRLCPCSQTVEELYLTGCNLTDQFLSTLFGDNQHSSSSSAVSFPKLKVLSVSGNDIGDTGVVAAAKALSSRGVAGGGTRTGLQVLKVCQSSNVQPVSDVTLQAIGDNLLSLRKLSLNLSSAAKDQTTDAGWARCLSSLGNLEHLELHSTGSNSFGPLSGAVVSPYSALLPRLQEMRFFSCLFRDDTLAAIGSGGGQQHQQPPAINQQQIKRLTFTHWGNTAANKLITDIGLTALVGSGVCAALESLTLVGQQSITDDTMAAISHCCQQLQNLLIDSCNHQNLTSDGLKQSFLEHPSLKNLGAEYCSFGSWNVDLEKAFSDAGKRCTTYNV